MIHLRPLMSAPPYLASPASAPPPLIPPQAPLGADSFMRTTDRAIDQATGTQVSLARKFDLLIDGAAAFPEMFRLIDGAQHHIHLETYIFENDLTAKQIAEALVRKAKQGVKVRVLADYVGGGAADKPIYRYLKANGVEVRVNNPPGGLLPNLFTFNRRDHRKMLIVDGDRAMTGGMNIGDEYQFQWHDVMVSVEGAPVRDMQQKFADMWRRNGGQMEASPLYFPASQAGTIPTRVIATDKHQHEIRAALLTAIDQAKTNINLEMAYFADRDLVDHLAKAARRGVKVRVIVPARSDLPIVDAAARFTFRKLMAAGAEVYLYKDRIMHTKGASVDGQWATIGSANGTNRAFRINQELNLAFTDREVVQKVDTQLFEADIAKSVRVTQPQSSFWGGLVSLIADLF